MPFNRQHVRPLLSALIFGAGSSAAFAQQDHPAVVFSEVASPTRSTSRELSGNNWATAANSNGLPSRVIWQGLVNSPSSSNRALMTVCNDNSMSLSIWSGSFWGAPTTMTTDSGSTTTKVFAMGYESESGQLMATYRKANSTFVYYRTYTSAIAPEFSLNIGLSAAPSWLELASRPRSDEMLLIVRAGTCLFASVWDGSAWGNMVTLETSMSTIGRACSVSYMSQSGKAMVVWGATTGAPKYRVWDGNAGAWGNAGTLPAIAGPVPIGWMRLASNPAMSSNEMLVAMIGTNKQINLNNWTGSAWGTNLVAETTAAASTERRVDIAYQPNGGGAVAVWHKSGQNALRYRTWSGSAWGAQTTGPDMGSETQFIQLAAGSDPTQVIMAARRRGAASYSDYLAYSASGDVNLTGTLNGPIGEGGVALPTPPSATAGGTPVILGNNDTRTISPGNYANLETGNACMLNFTTGTYVFTNFVAHNNGTVINCDTTNGPVNIILTAGAFDGKNGMVFNNLGSDQINLHILNGNFDSKNNNYCDNLAIFAYHGDIIIGSGLDFHGMLYASGNISGDGTISLPTNSSWSNGLGYVSAVTFTAGVPSTKIDLGTSADGNAHGECALAGKPPPGSMRVVRWREIGPDE